jgi:hypothetical protein
MIGGLALRLERDLDRAGSFDSMTHQRAEGGHRPLTLSAIGRTVR